MNNPIITADRLPHGITPRRVAAYPVRQSSGLLKIAPAIVLVLALMLPPEVRLTLAGQTLYAYRLAWILFLPWVIWRLLKGHLQWRINDLLVFAGSAWITFSFVMIYGVATGFPSGVGVTLDLMVPYFIARLSVSNLSDFRRLLVCLSPLFAFFAVLIPIEAYSHDRFVRDIASSIFGNLGSSEFGIDSAFTIASDTRYGFLRAMGPFSHPILAGIFFASLMTMYYWSQLKGWPRFIGFASGLAALFTFSSAAFLGIIIFVIFAGYDFLRKNVSFLNWTIFIVAVGVMGLVLQLISENGLVNVLIRMTLTPQTGYYRLLIWEYGTASIEKYPWFGIGYEGFARLEWMGDSIDTFWLNLAVRHGLPAALLLGASTVIAIIGVTRAAGRSKDFDEATLIGVAVTLLVLFIIAFSVSFFGGMLTWFVILLGVGTTLSGVQPPRYIGPSRLNRLHPNEL